MTLFQVSIRFVSDNVKMKLKKTKPLLTSRHLAVREDTELCAPYQKQKYTHLLPVSAVIIVETVK
jgi:hypothetical protein